MGQSNPWAHTIAKVRTIGFLVAMIPVLCLVGLVGILSLIVASPLVIYVAIRGKSFGRSRSRTGIAPGWEGP